MRSQKSFTSACAGLAFFSPRNLRDQIGGPAQCLERRAAPLQKSCRAARVEPGGGAPKLVADRAFLEWTLGVARHVDYCFLLDAVRCVHGDPSRPGFRIMGQQRSV